MIYRTLEMKETGSLPGSKLDLYLQDASRELKIGKRPLILICPGGGYGATSDREAEPVAFQFLAMGYHAAILRYSCAPARFPTALLEAASAMVTIRKNAEEWNVQADKIIITGFSAGGHLAASLGMFWNEDFVAGELGLKETEHALARPDGMILGYPVITSGKSAHRGSFENLLGEREEELAEKVSLEKQVSAKTPPAFIWHTFEDGSVPVENSLLLVSALREAEVSTEFHMFPRGCHGLSLANHLTESADGRAIQKECTVWIDLAHTWIENL